MILFTFQPFQLFGDVILNRFRGVVDLRIQGVIAPHNNAPCQRNGTAEQCGKNHRPDNNRDRYHITAARTAIATVTASLAIMNANNHFAAFQGFRLRLFFLFSFTMPCPGMSCHAVTHG